MIQHDAHIAGHNRHRLSRRTFLELITLASTSALSACADNSSSENSNHRSNESEPISKAWMIDFSTLADGPLSEDEWTFDTYKKSAFSKGGEQIPALGYNGENVAYTDRPRNIRVENGLLIIEALKEKQGGADYTSARVTTKGKHDMPYGSLTVSAKLPKGKGAWPAIWMLPSDAIYGKKYHGNANFDWYKKYMENGEIDLMEATAVSPGVVFGDTHTYNSITSGKDDSASVELGESIYNDFHDYGVSWNEDGLSLIVDGDVIYELKGDSDSHSYPFTKHQPMHLILNVAVGGEMGGDIDSDDFEHGQQMEIARITYTP